MLENWIRACVCIVSFIYEHSRQETVLAIFRRYTFPVNFLRRRFGSHRVNWGRRQSSTMTFTLPVDFQGARRLRKSPTPVHKSTPPILRNGPKSEDDVHQLVPLTECPIHFTEDRGEGEV